jgi:predicted permease
MDALLADLRFALRTLTSRPGFSALAVLTLAIGIGVNAVAFNALNGLLYKSSRFSGAESLGWIMMAARGNPYGHVSWLDYRDIAATNRAFEAVIAEGRRPLSFLDGNRPRQVWALCVSSNYFTALRADSAVGRVFSPSDLSAPEIPVVVSQRFWNERLGGGESLAGKTITLNARAAAIVGVMPDGFQGPGGFFEPELWIPLERADVLGKAERLASRDQAWLSLVGRLGPGVSAAQAATDLQTVLASLPTARPDPTRVRTMKFFPMLEGHPEGRGIAPYAYVALGIVSIVLLLACFNVAGLTLARAADRQREISVRAAVGASRGRIVRQFVLEGLLLALASGVAAVIIAHWSADLLSAFSLPAPIPQRLHMGVDRRVIAFTSALVALAGVLPALLPAFQATRADLLRSMKMDAGLGRHRSRARTVFVVAQIAGSTLMLTLAVLLARSFWAGSSTDPGFNTTQLLVVEIKPADYGYSSARTKAFVENLLERVRGIAGVEHASAADRIPFYVGFPRVSPVATAGTDCAVADCRSAFVYAVGTDHFKTLGVALRAGRDFTSAEIQAGEGAIVSQTMAARLWPGRNPVGESIQEGKDGRHLVVIGVAADIVHRTLNETPGEYLYRPLREVDYLDSLTIIARTSGDAGALAASVQEQVRALDPALPPGTAKTMTQRMELPLWPVRTAAGLFSICAALALVLATVGLFVTTYLAVGQRTREFGIRAALGATPRRVMTLVLRDGVRLALVGLVLGLAGAALASRAASSVVLRLDAADWPAYIVTAGLQTAVALVACLLPAHRATTVDPVVALRAE